MCPDDLGRGPFSECRVTRPQRGLKSRVKMSVSTSLYLVTFAIGTMREKSPTCTVAAPLTRRMVCNRSNTSSETSIRSGTMALSWLISRNPPVPGCKVSVVCLSADHDRNQSIATNHFEKRISSNSRVMAQGVGITEPSHHAFRRASSKFVIGTIPKSAAVAGAPKGPPKPGTAKSSGLSWPVSPLLEQVSPQSPRRR
jgi:hypothetical protein